jgi:hypothetical protein
MILRLWELEFLLLLLFGFELSCVEPMMLEKVRMAGIQAQIMPTLISFVDHIDLVQSQKTQSLLRARAAVRQTEQLGRRDRSSGVDSGELHARPNGSWAARKTNNVNALMFSNAKQALKG